MDRAAPDKAEVGRRLGILRRALGYERQNKMTAFLGERISPQQWNNYERGSSLPTIANARFIAMKCRVTVDWLFWGERAGLSVQMSDMLDDIERDEQGDAANRA